MHVTLSMVNIGVIGYGYWGPNLVRNIASIPTAHLSWICDTSESSLQKVKQLYPHTQRTNSIDDLLHDDTLDAIVIATPVETHADIARRVISAGKHVLIEKPFTSNARDARSLIALAKQKKVKLMVGHTFIYSGAVRKMKQLIDTGTIGDVFYFDSVRINLGLIREDINVLWDLAPHDISIMLHLMKQKPSYVHATGVCQIGKTMEEVAYLTIGFPNDAIAHIHTSWLSPVKVRRMLIGGSKKMLVYDDVEPSEKVRIYDKGVHITPRMKRGETPFTPLYRAGDILIPQLDHTETLRTECEHFIDCIINNTQPLSDGTAGLAVVEILEAAQKSLKTNKPVTLGTDVRVKKQTVKLKKKARTR